MNRYVVAFLCFHDNEIQMEEVLASSPLEAATKYINDFTAWSVHPITSLEELEAKLFDGDCLIKVLNLNNDSRAGRPGGGLQTHTAQFDSAASFHQ